MSVFALALQKITPSQFRGSIAGIYVFVMNIFGLTFGQFDIRYRKELGGFDFTTGLAFRGRPIIINPEINWEEEFGNAWWELAYSQGWTDQWYWISEEDGTGDYYWYNPDGELVTDSD